MSLDRQRIRSCMQAGLRRGMEKALEALAAASKAQAPKADGRLVASCRVRQAADGLSGRVEYTAPYAARQHEDRTYRHPGGGKAKYLEDPAHDPAVQRQMLEALAAGCREEMR